MTIRKMGAQNEKLPTAADIDPGSDEDEGGDGEGGKQRRTFKPDRLKGPAEDQLPEKHDLQTKAVAKYERKLSEHIAKHGNTLASIDPFHAQHPNLVAKVRGTSRSTSTPQGRELWKRVRETRDGQVLEHKMPGSMQKFRRLVADRCADHSEDYTTAAREIAKTYTGLYAASRRLGLDEVPGVGY